MTKYYFVSYMYQSIEGMTGLSGLSFSTSLCRVENKTLDDICSEIAKSCNQPTKTVVIIGLKDLTKKEYEMLKGDKE